MSDPSGSNRPDPLRVFAAGSLRAALTALIAELPAAHGVHPTFGPAGLLRERIEAGEMPDLFLSANTAHPATLAATRPGCMVQVFARNTLVAVARPDLGLTTENFLDRLLQDGVSIGTSTPVLDPSGDYAQQLFTQADAMREGAAARLRARAKHLVGERDAPAPVPGQYPARQFLDSGEVSVFLTYLSNAATMAEGLDVVIPPAALQVTAEYGLLVLATEPARMARASGLAAAILAPPGQDILRRSGFQPGD
jgi:molybdate transport system substrate-binding protein